MPVDFLAMYERVLGLVTVTSEWLCNLNLFRFCFPLMSNCSVTNWLGHHVSSSCTDFGLHLHLDRPQKHHQSFWIPGVSWHCFWELGKDFVYPEVNHIWSLSFFVQPSRKVMNKWLYLAENERPFAENGWRKVKFVTIVCCEIYIVKLMKNFQNWFLLSRGKAESGP